MPGNEDSVIELLLQHRLTGVLPILGRINSIGAPGPHGEITPLASVTQNNSNDAAKKADVYINDHGVSIKQRGGSFAFNRMQRKDLTNFFNSLGLSNPSSTLEKLDKLVSDFHHGILAARTQPPTKAFSASEFYKVLEYLMLKGSPSKLSTHPATFILSAPATPRQLSDLEVQTFEQYFEVYGRKIYLSIRRSWVGQRSRHEGGRARSIYKYPANAPWVFDNVSGTPATGWDHEVAPQDRKTCYYIMLEQVK